ncbi:hypothetical protein QYM36_019189, partial [Artemia franciscana]
MVNCHKNQKASILETGELVLSGKNIFSGYLGDEETTNKVIVLPRKVLGMDKCLRLFCIGFISDHIFDSLVDLGLRIQEVFGCSKTCGPHLWAKFNAEKVRVFNCHNNKKASILETENIELLDELGKMEEEMPQLKAKIFCCGKDPITAEDRHYSWDKLLEI